MLIYSKQSPDLRPAPHARVAEDVHQQRVRAAAGVELAQPSIILGPLQPVSDSKYFAQPSAPDWTVEDCAIACGMEIAVAWHPAFRSEDNASEIEVAALEDYAILPGILRRVR